MLHACLANYINLLNCPFACFMLVYDLVWLWCCCTLVTPRPCIISFHVHMLHVHASCGWALHVDWFCSVVALLCLVRAWWRYGVRGFYRGWVWGARLRSLQGFNWQDNLTQISLLSLPMLDVSLFSLLPRCLCLLVSLLLLPWTSLTTQPSKPLIGYVSFAQPLL